MGKILGTGATRQRELTGFTKRFVRVVAFIFAAIFIYSAMNGAGVYFGPRNITPFTMRFPFMPFFNDHFLLPLYLLFTSVLIFVLYPASKKSSPMDRPSAIDWLLCILALAVFVEYVMFYEMRGENEGLPAVWNDTLFGGIATVMALEICRRVLGNILPAMALLFMLYDWLGPYMPGDILSHKGQPWTEVLYMSYGASGMFGIVTRVFANVVFLFVVFGSFLQRTRVGDVFIDLAFAVVGRSRGGAAKAAVVSSCLVGSVVGSGAANIAITGTFTIPLMKKGGYSPEYAGAIEAVASIGGHLMPPVMGASVFLMAALTEIPYSEIIIISFVPAVLYYVSVFASAHLRACKKGIGRMAEGDIKPVPDILRKDGLLLLPLVVLVILLLYQFSPFYAAFWSLSSAVVCYTIRRKEWFIFGMEAAVFALGFVYSPGILYYVAAAALIGYFRKETRAFIQEIFDTFIGGSMNSLVIGATAGVMGVVLGAISHTGLGLKFPEVILAYSYDTLWIALILTALASYVLGMGMTIGASYILIVILAGPALQEFGLTMITAHLIVYWLSQDAALTPPFALGAFIAAGIAKGDPMMTGFHSLKIAKPLYLVPLMMAYSPAVLMQGGTPFIDSVVMWISLAIAFIVSAAALEGYFIRNLTLLDRAILLVATVLLMWPVEIAHPGPFWTKAAGLGLMGFSLYMQSLRPADFAENVAAARASATVATSSA